MNLDVVIVAYNSASRLPRVLDLLPGDTNVIVVDNASADGSADVAETHGATVVRGPVNAGFAAGCNRGAALGHAKTILFLNPDALIEPDALERLVGVFIDDPQIGVASPRLVYAHGPKQRVQWPYPSAAGAWREALGLHARVEESGGGFVIGACLAVRREAFEAVGGFDERFWLYGEEADLCRRIEDLGWTVRRIPSATATHEGGASAGDDPVENRVVFEHFIRGGEHFVDNHGGRGALASYRAANLVGSLGRGALGVGRRSAEHRRRAARLARTSLATPTRVALDSPATAAPGKGLVVCSLEAWDEVWRRNQFFVRELLAADPDLRVLFVEPAYDIVHERRRSSGREHAHGLRPVEADGRIVRFEPVKWVPRKFGKVADDWRDAQVLDAVRQLGFVEPRLWVNDPSYATLADRVDWPAVYDITDDWTEVADAAEAAKVGAWEARLFERCQAVTVCSHGLLDSRKPLRGDLELIPNAVDVEAMRRPRPRPVDLPAGPTAVYVGTLHADRLDVDLTVRLSQGLPDVTVVLVGPDALDDRSRRQLDDAGVVRLGPRPYGDVPAYLHHADVVVVPHVVSPFTDSLDPIKLYECLAVGTPTVATHVAGFRDAGDPIRTARPARFVDAVRGVLDDPPGPTPQTVPSWSERAAAFAEVLDLAARQDARQLLRVVYFDHCAQLSGGELALARLLPALTDVVEPLVILGERGPLEGVLSDRDLPWETIELDPELAHTSRHRVSALQTGPRAMVATAVAIGALTRRLRQLRPDLMHTNSLKAALIGGVAGRLAGVPVVWHIRDRMADDYLPNSAIRLVRTAASFLPTSIIVNSEATRAALGIEAAAVVPSPVDLGAFAEAPVGSPEASSELKFVMVGRLAPWKGQSVFVDAFAKAFPDGGARAALAGAALFGEDGYERQIADQVERLGIADRVDFLGFVDDIPALLADYDVLVHASTVPEPFGQVVVEGMAAGLAVAATDVGGPAEVITDGVDGVLFPPNDVDALAEVLVRLADASAERARLGAEGRRRAQDFSPSRIAPSVLGVYAVAARRNRARTATS
jgi:glycosyltransferase involved in cell wall biosynthesis/GT2 family glycosyltransferase